MVCRRRGAVQFLKAPAPSLWERACSRWHHCGLPGRPQRLHREQARSHKGLARFFGLAGEV
ncbi:hypothetical protein CJU73_09580 [Pseudomonas fragi]|nr:hypothetical protein CJU73_09580 [Pseudomonas fragi]